MERGVVSAMAPLPTGWSAEHAVVQRMIREGSADERQLKAAIATIRNDAESAKDTLIGSKRNQSSFGSIDVKIESRIA